MEIWIAEGDGKRGPFETYLVRGRIEEGDLSGDELAWHKDQDGWVKLREMDVFRSSFEIPGEGVSGALPPPLPVEPYPFLRFFARWFDISLYLLFFFSLFRLAGQDFVPMALGPFLYLYFLPCLLLEAAILHKLAATPGKYLLGIRVSSADDKHLSIQAALVRSLRAFIVGLGLMVNPILTGICHVYCLWYLLRRKEAPWDTMTTTRVVAQNPQVSTVLRFSLLFLIVLSLLFVVLRPAFYTRLEEIRDEVRKRAGEVR